MNRRHSLALLSLGLLAACQEAWIPGQADRGIGGTGQTADRGIGGTGIVGAITGFGSIRVNGVEVALGPATTVSIDAMAATPADLRIGQVVAISATDGKALHTDHVAAYHAVSGPIWTATPDRLVVAGQMVYIDQAVPVLGDPAPGAWIAVSGLRDLSGVIHATLVDARSPGQVVVAGRPKLVGNTWRLGGLTLEFGRLAPPASGQLLIRGMLRGTALVVTALDPSPSELLTQGAVRQLREGYAAIVDGRLELGDGTAAVVGPDFARLPPAGTRLVVTFVANPEGGLVATLWHAAGAAATSNAGPAPPSPANPPAGLPAGGPGPPARNLGPASGNLGPSNPGGHASGPGPGSGGPR
jgi:Domain of unknown function (DUF5666)